MKFTGWDRFKDIKDGSFVKDKDGNIFKVHKKDHKMIYLEIVKTPSEMNNFVFKKIPIYWSNWELINYP